MDNIRTAINEELQQRKWSWYRLAEKAGGRVSYQSIAQYLGGRQGLSMLNLEILLDVLDLKVK